MENCRIVINVFCNEEEKKNPKRKRYILEKYPPRISDGESKKSMNDETEREQHIENLELYSEILELQILCGKKRNFWTKKTFEKEMKRLKDKVFLEARENREFMFLEVLKTQVNEMPFLFLSNKKGLLRDNIRNLERCTKVNKIEILEKRLKFLTIDNIEKKLVSKFEIEWLKKVIHIFNLNDITLF